MSIFDFDVNHYARQTIPPDKRLPKIVAFVYALLSSLRYNTDAYALYRLGDTYNPYNSGAVYAINTIITYLGKNYISLQNGNVDNRPDISPAWWQITNDSATGSDERIRYQPNKLIFEYALNKYFGGTFRQPPLVSDIYVENTAYFNPSFIVGGIESNSSVVYADRSSGYVINDYFVQPEYSFKILMPDQLFIDAGNTEESIRNFADNYVVAGKKYLIETY